VPGLKKNSAEAYFFIHALPAMAPDFGMPAFLVWLSLNIL
jgi:hypothetical protein